MSGVLEFQTGEGQDKILGRIRHVSPRYYWCVWSPVIGKRKPVGGSRETYDLAAADVRKAMPKQKPAQQELLTNV